MTELDALIDAFADRVVRKLMTAQTDDHIDQVRSPLGRRKHCSAVRARIARGAPGAAIVGRRHLLTRAALDEELGGTQGSNPPADPLADYRKKKGARQ